MLIIKSSNLSLPKLIYLKVEMFRFIISSKQLNLPTQSRLSASDLPPAGGQQHCFLIRDAGLSTASLPIASSRQGPFLARFHAHSCCSPRASAWIATIHGVFGEHVTDQSYCSPGLCCSTVRGGSTRVPGFKSRSRHLPSVGPQTITFPL